MNEDECIESYLDCLALELRGDPRAIRRILQEAEAHLRDAIDAGTTVDDAVARFGDPREVAAAHRRTTTVPLATIVRQLVLALGLLGSLGLVAVGVSGLVTVAMDAAWGPDFVAGDLPTITYTSERCLEYHALAPDEPTCLSAAARHHTDEIELARVGTGVVGLLGLGTWILLRRRWRRYRLENTAQATLIVAVGASVFGVAAVTTGSQTLQSVTSGTTNGVGQWLSATLVAAAAAIVLGVAYVRRARHPSAI